MDIRIITPPDIIQGYTKSILLIHPSTIVKEQLQENLLNTNTDIDIYLYNQNKEDHEVDWFFNVLNKVDIIVLDVDNCEGFTKDVISYVLGFNKTFWLTKGEHPFYNKINRNRVYSLDFIKEKLGVTVEEQAE
jgi:hypothetical protein